MSGTYSCLFLIKSLRGKLYTCKAGGPLARLPVHHATFRPPTHRLHAEAWPACSALTHLSLQHHGSPARRLHAEAWPVCSALTHLVIGNAALHCEDILRKCPNITLVELDGSTLLTRETTLAHSLEAVAECCPNVTEVRCQIITFK